MPYYLLIKKWGGCIAGLIGTTGLMLYISQYASEFYRLRDFSFFSLGLLSIIVLIGHLIIAIKFQLMAYLFDISLSLWDAFILTETGGLLNIIPLNLGTGFRAAYLKKMKKLKFIDFGLGFLIFMLTEFIAAGILGATFLLTFSNSSIILQFVFLSFILVPLLLIGIAWRLKKRGYYQISLNYKGKGLFNKLIQSLLFSLNTILTQPLLIFYCFCLNIFTGLLLGIRYWLVAKWLGYSMSFASSMVLQSVGRATAGISVIPSGTIGLREALTGLGAAGLRESPVIGVMISTVDRIVATTWIILFGTIGLFFLRKKISILYQQNIMYVGKDIHI